MADTSIGGHWRRQGFLPGQMGLAIIEQPHVQNERSEFKNNTPFLIKAALLNWPRAKKSISVSQ
jgi:hypothetical protein